MKKKATLILTLVLSLAMFLTNMAGLTVVVHADEVGASIVDEPLEQTVDENNGNENNGNENNGPSEDELERQRREEEERRLAEEREREAAIRQAEEEAARIAEEAYQQQLAMEQAAQLALETAKAEEEQRQREAEEKQRAAEEAERQAASQNYSLSAYLRKTSSSSTPTTKVDFGSTTVGTQLDYIILEIMNTGTTAVDLMYRIADDYDGAFSASLHGDKRHLEPNESARFNISLSSNLDAGTYIARLLLADVNKDPNYNRGLSITLRGTVTAKQAKVTSVSVTPSKATLAVGNDYQFYATVKGSGDVDQSVSWSLVNQQSSGTRISSDGLLTIANDERSGSLTVVATSNADRSVSAYATVTPQRSSYNVGVSIEPNGGGSVAGGGAVSQGGSVTLSASPSKNYYFVGWVRDGKTVSTSTSYSISNIQSNINVTAKFAQNYVTITAESNNSNGGTVSGGGKVTVGGSTTLSAKAYSGYVFTGWKEGGNIVSRDASIKVDNCRVDRKFTAVFEQTSHTIVLAANPQEGGTVSGGGTFPLGQGTTIKAQANNGYEFQEWQINGQTVYRTDTVKIDKLDRDCTVTAIFRKKDIQTYVMSSGVATTGGSVSPSGKMTVTQGQNVTYTFTPQNGFAVLAVAVDGVQVGAVNTYTFTNIQASHSISVAFVQTDAGRKNAAASGQQVQTQKVQKIEKTEQNTATEQSTVSLEDAVAGTAGDDFVEEMDLDNIAIPSDEELGVEETQATYYSAVSEMLGMSVNEVHTMIAQGNIEPVLYAAFYTGNLTSNVVNQLAPSQGVNYNEMSTEELMLTSVDDINPSLPNLDIVVERMLSTNEVTALADGGFADVSVSLTKKDETGTVVEKLMQNAVGQKPLEYFDLTMMKTANGYSELVTEIPEAMEVVVEIPLEYRQSGKTYSIIRLHNGELTVLPDLDNDPTTVTFRTDRFSSYALAMQTASSHNMLVWFAVGGAVSFGIAMTCILIMVAHQAKYRRSRKRRQ